MQPLIYSLGYEGRSLASVVGFLEECGVRTLVDVRLTPWSRKKGFSRGTLEAVLKNRRINYRHEPRLGNPKSNREGFRADSDEFIERFHAATTDADQAIEEIVALAQVGPVAVLCFERDEVACHRSLVISAIKALKEDVVVLPAP